jgi:hypothetical protein
MATVLLQKFGRSPSFLRLKTSQSLFDLILTRPKLGVSLKVVPTQFYKMQRSNYYYTITKVSPPKSISDLGRVYAKKTFNGVESDKQVLVPTYHFKNWHLYE